ncbi:unnamed protein product [Calicophoron daubneyi]|uniref:Uncharacterized protein n=1 Tax=Calicophoron daubneyi TaxID=300641 RepID=A0AAV2TEE0_CALDB
MLSRPASPSSRRSSSISTFDHGGISTVQPLYCRVPAKKKSQSWKVVCLPLPPNTFYRRSLVISLLLTSFGSLVFLTATMASTWESVHYRYDKVFQYLDFNFVNIRTETNGSLSSNPLSAQPHPTTGSYTVPNFTVELLVLQNGQTITPAQIEGLRIKPELRARSLKRIAGLLVRLSNLDSVPNRCTVRPLRKRGVLPPLHKNLAGRPLYNMESYYLDDELSKPMDPEVAWIIMDIEAGIWSMSYEKPRVYSEQLAPSYYNICKGPSIGLPSLSYLSSNVSNCTAKCSQFFLKMQNNIIASAIVVYLSMLVSIIIGLFGVIFRNVPASMVTGVLHFIAGLFAIFVNCIHHTKLSRLRNEWGPCHPISRVPDRLYDPAFITVNSHWPLIVSWISSPIFLLGFCTWTILTQLMTTENSKMMI